MKLVLGPIEQGEEIVMIREIDRIKYIIMKSVLGPIEKGEETCYGSQEDLDRTLFSCLTYQ